jgi:hypothetical protein
MGLAEDVDFAGETKGCGLEAAGPINGPQTYPITGIPHAESSPVF